jgi:hypothetical protein
VIPRVRNCEQTLGSIPAAMQLHYLQMLTDIGAEQNSTTIFPIPLGVIKPFLDLIEKTGRAAVGNGVLRQGLPAVGPAPERVTGTPSLEYRHEYFPNLISLATYAIC